MNEQVSMLRKCARATVGVAALASALGSARAVAAPKGADGQAPARADGSRSHASPGDAGSGGAVAAPVASGAAAGGSSNASERAASATCTEHMPPGAARPGLSEQFPTRGLSGYASVLEIAVLHGKGETVFPQGFALQSGGEAARAFADAGFVFPDPDGGAGPTLTTTATASGATTNIAIPVLVLPKTPGRNAMTLPPVPVALARASGELVTICTHAHHIVVDDPTSSTPDAEPRGNPPGRTQLEEWTLAKQLTIGGAIGAALAALIAWLLVRWMRRPKPVPPPPPPRPPWEVALEELFAIRHAGLVQDARYAEHYDRISDAIRKYLGGRYGFDGLETTTPEMTALLRRVEPPVAELPVIFGFLDECDLVKFARFTPSDEDCARVLDQAEHIVRATTPRNVPQTPSAGVPPSATASGRAARDSRHAGSVRDDRGVR